MNFKILKKDLQRKKSMNFVIMIFVVMTTMFVASSIKNLRVSLNGVDEFLEISDVRDFFIVAKGDVKDNANELLSNSEYVKDYYEDDSITLASHNVFYDNASKPIEFNSAIFLQKNTGNQKFFNEDNKEITEVKDGTIYIPATILDANKIKIGDSVRIKIGDYKKDFEVVGELKDAIMGSQLMGNKRMIISDSDYDEAEKFCDAEMIIFFGVDTDNVSKVKAELKDNDITTMFAEGKSVLKTCYIMDVVISLVMLLVSICLVVISGIMLRYTIVFTVNEDYKEIGIMKAIGLKSSSIRKLYATKYLVISVLGAVVGFFVSIPFSKTLLESITKTIVLKDKGSGYFVEFITAAIVAAIVTGLAYKSTKPIKKLTPMDAIRGGNNGERFKRKGKVSLKKTRLKATSFMAVCDVLAEWKKYIILVITSMIGVWLAVMPANTINTLTSDNMIDFFGIVKCDYSLNDDTFVNEILFNATSDDEIYDKIHEVETKLRDGGVDVDRVVMEMIFSYTARKDDKSYTSMTLKGYNSTTDEYLYEQGTAPRYANEVAITHVVAKELGAKLGDTIYIKNHGEEKAYTVTAIFQTMNNMGQGIRFSDEEQIDYANVSGYMGVSIFLKGNPSKADIDDAIEKTKAIYPDSDVLTLKEMINSTIGGVVDQLSPLKGTILLVVIIVNFMVITLMQKMFIIREVGEMGMLKAIGFPNKDLVMWQVKRAFFAIIIGIVLGTATGTVFTQYTSGFVFKFMGAKKMNFDINVMESYVIFPIAIVLMTVLGCAISMLKIRKINVFNMNEME